MRINHLEIQNHQKIPQKKPRNPNNSQKTRSLNPNLLPRDSQLKSWVWLLEQAGNTEVKSSIEQIYNWLMKALPKANKAKWRVNEEGIKEWWLESEKQWFTELNI